jgi:hypothetical protein
MSILANTPVYMSNLEFQFAALAFEWKRDRGVSSSSRELAQHPAYQAIIELGDAAVPLLLRELEREPDHWFIALKTITNADPIQLGSRGNLPLMTKDWVKWGRANGYRW